MTHARTVTFTTSALLAGLLVAPMAQAAIDASWTGTSGNWSDAAKWSTNPDVPDQFDDIARITTGSGPTTLDISGVVIGQLINTQGKAWQINKDVNDHSLTFQVSSGSALIQAISAVTTSVTINPNVIIASDLVVQANGTDAQSQTTNLNGTLTGTGNVTFDLAGGGNNATRTINVASVNTAGTLTAQGNKKSGDVTTIGTIGSNVTTLTKTGVSTLVLTGANTYTGATTLSGGTIRARLETSLSDYTTPGNLSIASGATLTFNVGGAGQWTAANIDTLRSAATIASGWSTGLDTSNAASPFTYNSTLGNDVAAFSKLGVNELILGGTNGHTGTTTVSAGTLTVTNSSALGSTAGGTSVSSSAALQLDGTGGDLVVGNEALTINGSGVSSNGALRNLVGDNSWAGVVNVGGGATIRVETGTSLDLSGGVTSSGAGTRIATFAGGGQTTVNGMGTNAATGLTVTGGTVILNGASGYDRATTVSGGTLVVNGTIDAAGLAVTVGTAGTLGGSGSIARDVVINGTLKPGNSAGTLTIDNSVTLASTTVSDFELDSAASFDRLLVNTVSNAALKTFNFDGTLNVIDNGVAFANGQVFDLFDWGNNTIVSGTFSAINLPTLTGALEWKEYTPGVFFDYSTGQIEVTVIPEPASLALLALGGLLMLSRRRINN